MKKTTKTHTRRRTPKVTREDNPTASTAGRRAKPKTAYELLQRVCEEIKANPLNYYQNQWKSSRRYDRCKLPAVLDRPENTCGTAMCRAGWIVDLADGFKPRRSWRFKWAKRARVILGMAQRDSVAWPPDDVQRLFESFEYDSYGEAIPEPGTREYVQRGIKGLRDFMKRHRTHLENRKLKGVPHV